MSNMTFEYWKKPQGIVVNGGIAYGKIGCNLYLLKQNGMARLACHGSAVNPDFLLNGLKPDMIVLRFPQSTKVCQYSGV